MHTYKFSCLVVVMCAVVLRVPSPSTVSYLLTAVPSSNTAHCASVVYRTSHVSNALPCRAVLTIYRHYLSRMKWSVKCALQGRGGKMHHGVFDSTRFWSCISTILDASSLTPGDPGCFPEEFVIFQYTITYLNAPFCELCMQTIKFGLYARVIS